MQAIETFWYSCLKHFKKELNAQQFNTWIKPLQLDTSEGCDDQPVLIAPNGFVLQWVKDNFIPHIEVMAQQHFSKKIHFQLILGNTAEAKTSNDENLHNVNVSNRSVQTIAAKPASKKRNASHLNPNFTFDSFVTGKANQLARAGAIQVAERPGIAYNPLFIYGGVGLGKTHLIQAIGNYVLANDPEAKVRYVHAEKYVSDVVSAYQHKSFDKFKLYYHSLDVLLVDDVQFFGGKNRTQEEFFYAFNTLVEAHKQVIITCDSYPKEISGLEERLVSRFGWGLTVAVEPPELEMRVAILLKKASIEKIALDENVAFFVAKHIRSNVRELEGALKRILAYSRFIGQPISLELAKEALKDLLAVQNRQISIENIQKTVADYYKIKVAEMYSKKRTRIVARPRQIAMAVAKELTQLSLPDIGEAFGGRDHTTVLHAYRKITELRASDPTISRDYNALLHILRG
ncbi:MULTISPECIES: chromosomal replication initiator protein DnaA [unclassified Nitrosomonas]|jgi:chromosomal replication initiator protein|uniref:chromosomal replication initiator protein DnaA n=1 Tax=unclassified Nitrosomonas TaxID=2609265 RepID=UPI000884F2C4|nr:MULTISPECIES: chromosomal replication initiator protein DnaA [unclassified Nitrosomonas]SDH03130.1 chromosomal replication initiator protein [Nitrosomonas sp. Nm132]SDY12467.1 chromosomal replication initiator protein [Nitrosomonas sp. Nm58]